jgi:hypothetical protein
VIKVVILIFSWIVGVFGFLAVMVPVQWVFGTIRAPGRVVLVSAVLGFVMIGLAVAGTKIYERLKQSPPQQNPRRDQLKEQT